MRPWLLALAVIWLSGCVIGKHPEEKSRLERLNGENYDGSGNNVAVVGTPAAPIYIGNQTARSTKISGNVWLGEGIERTPAGHAHLQVEKDGRVLTEADAETDGGFKIYHVLPDGAYLLRADLGARKAELPFEVKGYEVKDLSLTLK